MLQTKDSSLTKSIYLQDLEGLKRALATTQLTPSILAAAHNDLIECCFTAGYEVMSEFFVTLPPTYLSTTQQIACWLEYFSVRGKMSLLLECAVCTSKTILVKYCQESNLALLTPSNAEDLIGWLLKHGVTLPEHIVKQYTDEIVSVVLTINKVSCYELLLTSPLLEAELLASIDAVVDNLPELKKINATFANWLVSHLGYWLHCVTFSTFRLICYTVSDDVLAAALAAYPKVQYPKLLSQLCEGYYPNSLRLLASTLPRQELTISISIGLWLGIGYLIDLGHLHAIRLVAGDAPPADYSSLAMYLDTRELFITYNSSTPMGKRNLLLTTVVGKQLGIREILKYVTLSELPSSIYTPL